MGYRRHTAREDVLAEAGRARHHGARELHRARGDAAQQCGLATVRFETLAQTLLAAGEADQFAAALAGAAPRRSCARRMQLKTLLFGMGETFRVLLQRKMEKESWQRSGGKA